MKQHITASDLDQLTPAGKEKYFEWINRKCFYSGLNILAGEKPVAKRSKHLMNIGEMIELLDEHSILFKYDYVEEIFLKEDYGDDGKKYVEPEEFCDALWSACVELLNKD